MFFHNDGNKIEQNDTDWVNDNFQTYYMFEDDKGLKQKYSFHPAFYIFKRILLLMQEYEKKNNFKFTDKERMLVLGTAAESFQTLESEWFQSDANSYIDHPNDKIRSLVTKILPSIERIKESKSANYNSKESGSIDDYSSNVIKANNKLHSNGSKVLDPLSENINSASSAFECYSTNSKTSPSEK